MTAFRGHSMHPHTPNRLPSPLWGGNEGGDKPHAQIYPSYPPRQNRAYHPPHLPGYGRRCSDGRPEASRGSGGRAPLRVERTRRLGGVPRLTARVCDRAVRASPGIPRRLPSRILNLPEAKAVSGSARPRPHLRSASDNRIAGGASARPLFPRQMLPIYSLVMEQCRVSGVLSDDASAACSGASMGRAAGETRRVA